MGTVPIQPLRPQSIDQAASARRFKPLVEAEPCYCLDWYGMTSSNTFSTEKNTVNRLTNQALDIT